MQGTHRWLVGWTSSPALSATVQNEGRGTAERFANSVSPISLFSTMACVAQRRTLTPKSQRSTRHTFSARSAFNFTFGFEDNSSTTFPITPELEWVDTPPATEDPPTPGDVFDVAHSKILPQSPLSTLKLEFQTNKDPLLDLSALDFDIPERLLSPSSNGLYQSGRIFEKKIPNVTLTATSQQQPYGPTDDRPVALGVSDEAEARSGSFLGSASHFFSISPKATQPSTHAAYDQAPANKSLDLSNSIEAKKPLIAYEEVVSGDTDTGNTTVAATTSLSQCVRRLQPLTLSVVWTL